MKINSYYLKKIFFLSSLILLSSLICLFLLKKIHNKQIIIPKQNLETKNEDELKENLEEIKIKFIEFQIEANFSSQQSNNPNKKASEIAQAALKNVFTDNFVIELFNYFDFLASNNLKNYTRKGIEFLYENLISKEKDENKKNEINPNNDKKKKYCEDIINPIINLIIENYLENKTEYNYQEISIEINKFFKDLKKIELNKEQKIQAIQYIKLLICEHIFAFDIQAKISILEQNEKNSEKIIEIFLNNEDFLQNLADYSGFVINDFKQFKEKLKTKLKEKIPKDIYKDNNFVNFFKFSKFDHVKKNEGITKIFIESFKEIKKELLNQIELTKVPKENEASKKEK